MEDLLLSLVDHVCEDQLVLVADTIVVTDFLQSCFHEWVVRASAGNEDEKIDGVQAFELLDLLFKQFQDVFVGLQPCSVRDSTSDSISSTT